VKIDRAKRARDKHFCGMAVLQIKPFPLRCKIKQGKNGDVERVYDRSLRTRFACILEWSSVIHAHSLSIESRLLFPFSGIYDVVSIKRLQRQYVHIHHSLSGAKLQSVFFFILGGDISFVLLYVLLSRSVLHVKML
jgi:hypothetical protein